jgi:hypothetical protein
MNATVCSNTIYVYYVISNFVAGQAYGQMQFCCCVFILPALCEENAIKWGGMHTL